MIAVSRQFLKKYFEAIIWSGALVLLFYMNPASGTSLCILKAAGISWCPGCGLGHAIHYALHFNFTASLEAHLLGIPATILFIYQTIKSVYLTKKTINYGSA